MEPSPRVRIARLGRGRLLPLILLPLPPLALLWLSWRRWFHFAIDFGRELYVPWRLSEGDRLFVEVAYFNGPLSPYLNALGFKLFGVGFDTVLALNLLVLAFVAILVYRLLQRLGGAWSAVAGTLVFFLLFALADPTGSGNYNYLAPYSHEMTHGLLLALAAVLALLEALESARPRWWGAAGLLLGLLFLTKAEIFLAAFAAAGVALTIPDGVEKRSLRHASRRLAAFGLAFSLVLAAAWLLLATSIGSAAALEGILGTWPHVLGTDLDGSRFYRRSMGLLDPGASLLALGRAATIYLVTFAPILALSRHRLDAVPARRLVRVAAVVWIALAAAAVWRFLDPSDLPRALPLIVGASLVASALDLLRHRRQRTYSPFTPAFLVTSVFAFVLLLKILLRARFHHYGFVLAMPATLILVAVLLDRLPAWLSHAGHDGGLMRWAGGES